MNLAEQEYLEAPVKITKLSQAIREGAKIRPQCFGALFANGGSCALGAAWEGLGHPAQTYDPITNSTAYHELERLYGAQVSFMVHSKNDMGESRESIASWLESKGL